MNDREKWKERVRDIHTSDTTWWWWWWFRLTLLIHLHTVKRVQVLLCITNNSVKHQSFVYIHLNDQTVLFQTIQFSITHLLVLSLNVKQFYLTHWPHQVLLLRVTMGLRAMTINGYTEFSKAPRLEPRHQMV